MSIKDELKKDFLEGIPKKDHKEVLYLGGWYSDFEDDTGFSDWIDKTLTKVRELIKDLILVTTEEYRFLSKGATDEEEYSEYDMIIEKIRILQAFERKFLKELNEEKEKEGLK